MFSGKYCVLCSHNRGSNDNRRFLEGVQVDDNHKQHPFVICEQCISLLSETMSSSVDPSLGSDNKDNGLVLKHTPRTIVEHLDQYIIGQEDAKRHMAVVVYNHYKRLQNPNFNGVEINKSNMLMIGPTGSGKTLLVQSIAKLLDIPFAIVDATSLTEAGYVGDDVEVILQRLISSANGDIEKAQKGIIFIDEIDKIAKRNNSVSVTRDVSGEGVQQALLKIIEGTIVRVPATEGHKHAKTNVNVIDTSNILFICGGAFVGLDKIIEKKTSVKSMGFTTPDISEEDLHMRNMLTLLGNSVNAEDLSLFGMIPEFIGRLPIIVELQELTKEQMRQIITEPKNAVLKQMQALFAIENVELVITDKALDQIIDLTMARKTGARGIRAILEKVLTKTMFELPDLVDVAKIYVDDIYQEPQKISKNSKIAA